MKRQTVSCLPVLSEDQEKLIVERVVKQGKWRLPSDLARVAQRNQRLPGFPVTNN
jgi:hypothetical protein